MSNQPDPLLPNVPDPAVAPPPTPASTEKPRIPLWLRRAELFLRVVVRIYVGVLILLLPWTRLWDNNRLFLLLPSVGHIANFGAVKGIVSGIGILNLWIAITAAVRYREP